MLKPKCPYCGSTNVSVNETQATRASKKVLAGMVFLPLVFLAGRKPKEPGECFDCGRRWKIK